MNIKEKGICILLSLSFHVLIFFLLLKVVPPVKFYLYRQVADVRIISSESIYIPRIAGLLEESPLPEQPSQSAPEELSDPGIVNLPQELSPEPGVVYLRNLAVLREARRTDLSGSVPSFDLVPSPKAKGGFSLGIEREKTSFEEKDQKEPSTKLDLSAYDSPALSSLPFNRIITRKGRDTKGRITKNLLDSMEGYDISPWVKGVLDKIRDMWILPPIDESIAIGELKIYVVFGKEGEVISMEIVESSDFDAFDQTAIRAIRSGAPFSPLPDDFPSERLEAFLVFQFNE